MDRDFTLNRYENYLNAIKENFAAVFRFDDFLKLNFQPKSFALIRHDIDRKPLNALRMAELEYEQGVQTTYYIRTKSHTFKPEIIRQISQMGHEIGFHYESLSDTNGDFEKAYNQFCSDLKKLRGVVPVSTISMHGRPFKPYDNRDLWKYKDYHKRLKEELDIAGEVYLDMDYTDITYINDTGRNWSSRKNNLRDRVSSEVSIDFSTGKELLSYLKGSAHPKLVFQVHPERWTDDKLEWSIQATKDASINLLKTIITSILK